MIFRGLATLTVAALAEEDADSASLLQTHSLSKVFKAQMNGTAELETKVEEVVAVSGAGPSRIRVTIGNSWHNTRCVHMREARYLKCHRTSTKHNRANRDYWWAGDTFHVTTHSDKVCARRTDWGGGWGMQLAFDCTTDGYAIVDIGNSHSNTRCAHRRDASLLVCEDSDKHNRLNTDYSYAPDTFDMTTTGNAANGQVCARRTDAHHGWGMQLKTACKMDYEKLNFGRSHSNKVCIHRNDAMELDCENSHKNNRLNSDYAYAGDTFDITFEGTNKVCARRTDSAGGWGMELSIGCKKKDHAADFELCGNGYCKGDAKSLGEAKRDLGRNGCAQACNDKDHCNSFVYDTHNGRCYLRHQTDKPGECDSNRNGWTYWKEPPEELKEYELVGHAYCQPYGYGVGRAKDWLGQSGCGAACNNEDHCNAFVYDTHNGHCYLKHQPTKPDQCDSNRNGWSYWQAPAEELSSYELVGNAYCKEYGAAVGRAADWLGQAGCAQACTDNEACNAFVYDTHNGHCYLKFQEVKPGNCDKNTNGWSYWSTPPPKPPPTNYGEQQADPAAMEVEYKEENQDNDDAPAKFECAGSMLNGKCLWVLPNVGNYEQAMKACEDQGGSIASIHSTEENTLVRRLVQVGGDLRSAYIGATRECNGQSGRDCGAWGWDDGSEWWTPAAQYHDGLHSNGNSWHDGRGNHGETHIVMHADGRWHDWARGNSRKGAVCQATPPPEEDAEVEAAVEASAECQGQEVNGVCFWVIGEAGNFEAAVEKCEAQGGEIAAIHSKEENDVVRQLVVGGEGLKSAYIGATRDCNRGRCSGWAWDDGSEWWIPSANFHDGLNSNGNTWKDHNGVFGETHIVMHADGKWHDWARGTSNKGAVCMSVTVEEAPEEPEEESAQPQAINEQANEPENSYEPPPAAYEAPAPPPTTTTTTEAPAAAPGNSYAAPNPYGNPYR